MRYLLLQRRRSSLVSRPRWPSDDFNRSDETPLGSPWTGKGGAIAALANLANNRVKFENDAGGFALYQHGTALPSGDAQVAADVSVAEYGNCGVVGRWDGVAWSSSTLYVALAVAQSGGSIQLARVVSGVYTTLGTHSIGGGGTLAGHIALRMVGDSIVVVWDDEEVISVTDDTIPATNTGAGFWRYDSVTTDTWLDNWETEAAT